METISLEMKHQEIDGRCIQIRNLQKVYSTNRGNCSAVKFFMHRQHSKCFGDDKFELFAPLWREAGANMMGGCCRTTASTIEAISTFKSP
nr:homocysteine S-methyltransferase 1 [Ipomoea batatas]